MLNNLPARDIQALSLVKNQRLRFGVAGYPSRQRAYVAGDVLEQFRAGSLTNAWPRLVAVAPDLTTDEQRSIVDVFFRPKQTEPKARDALHLGEIAAALGDDAGPFVAHAAKRIQCIPDEFKGDRHERPVAAAKARAKAIAAFVKGCPELPPAILAPMAQLAGEAGNVGFFWLRLNICEDNSRVDGVVNPPVAPGPLAFACAAGIQQLPQMRNMTDFQNIALDVLRDSQHAPVQDMDEHGPANTPGLRLAVIEATGVALSARTHYERTNFVDYCSRGEAAATFRENMSAQESTKFAQCIVV